MKTSHTFSWTTGPITQALISKINEHNVKSVHIKINELGGLKLWEKVTDILSHCPNIIELNLAGIGLAEPSNIQAILFTKALRNHTNIDKLNLDSNHIGYKGLNAIKEALIPDENGNHNKSLDHLDIRNNEIGVQTAHVLKDLLSSKNYLHKIQMGNNSNYTTVERSGLLGEDCEDSLCEPLFHPKFSFRNTLEIIVAPSEWDPNVLSFINYHNSQFIGHCEVSASDVVTFG